ncbi:glutamate ABC transporter substrate-binding protein [Yinghuangia seranimata]|uniref:glutamate ABC transporter substrate-binding protein n=1 Tax=Yinghuangia seranimata TaxID=408067 RepID=UPI00248B7927|nr:glutamate ABC transporter substrate-binding protein [Yinghuangia seranimata]MDI2131046.1 glutamate ABC transporter substrate-binding protein [Yinghuangia seranimata]
MLQRINRFGRRAAAASATLVLVAAVANADGSPAVSQAPPPEVRVAAAPQADDTCDTKSSLPPAKNVNGAKIQKIRAAGTLVVGIDLNSYHWGYRNPGTGKIEGFDIDLAHAIAASVLGDPNKITYKAVPTARRIDALKSGEVDMIVRTMTITCDRLKDISFSVPYFRVSQSAVVPVSAPEAATIDQALVGKRVCAADKSSSSTELATGKYPATSVTIVENQLDCLVLMQLGKIDTTLADTVLAYAQAAQDPGVRVEKPRIVPAYMGVGMNKADTDLIAWVNQVIADYRSSGGWQTSYDQWLRPTMEDPGQYLP